LYILISSFRGELVRRCNLETVVVILGRILIDN
jgi:hypothetical protein